jgi:hypothetical protein
MESLNNNPDVIFAYVLDAASRSSMKELIYVWLLSFYLNHTLAIRTLINKLTPNLAERLVVHFVEDDFPAFLKVYYRQHYGQWCNWDPNVCLLKYVREEDWLGVYYAISIGARCWNKALNEAVLADNDNMVSFFVGIVEDNWDWFLESSVSIGSLKFVKLFVKKGATQLQSGMNAAAIRYYTTNDEKYLNIVYFFYNQGATPPAYLSI